MSRLTRRDLVRSAVGGAAGLVLGGISRAFAQEFYSRAAGGLGPARGARVVIVGGGWGGVTAARYLRRARPDAEVVLIEQRPLFMSCPLSNLYLAGARPLDFFVFDYLNVVRDGVYFVHERAVEVDRERRRVVTTGGAIEYDYLVLAAGIEYMYEAIEGYPEVRHLMPVAFRPFEHIALRRQLEQFEGGELVIGIPKPPYRCPPGPYERAAMLAWYLKENQIPGKVVVLDANNEPLAKPVGFMAAYQELYAEYVEYYPNAEVTGVDYARKVVHTSLGEFPFTLANIVPPMRSAEIVRQAGLGQRWAEVQTPYFVSKADDRVYLIGDVVGNTPFPKSGQIAYNEGRITASHLAARISGRRLDEIPYELPSNICYSFVDSEEAIWVAANYGWDEAERVIRGQARSDQKRSVQNGQLALEWARGLWNDMFGA